MKLKLKISKEDAIELFNSNVCVREHDELSTDETTWVKIGEKYVTFTFKDSVEFEVEAPLRISDDNGNLVNLMGFAPAAHHGKIQGLQS